MSSNYLISKAKKGGEVVYLEYNKEGYNVKPKVQKKDAIEVNKIVFVSPLLTEKLLKKKINSKISKLLLELNTTYDDEEDGGTARYRNKLMEAERIKLMIMNTYQKYLGKSYVALTIKKMQIIIDGYKAKLYEINSMKQREMFHRMINGISYDEEEPKRGKGR